MREWLGAVATVLLAVLGLGLAVSPLRPAVLSRIPVGKGGAKVRLAVLASLLGALAFLAFVLLWAPHYRVMGPDSPTVVLGVTRAVTVQVKNDGLVAGTYRRSYTVDGYKRADLELHLDGRQRRTISLVLPLDLSPGAHTLALGGTEIAVMALRPADFRVGKLNVKPKVAKIGEAIEVRASVENVGDIGGTFPGVLTANGHRVEAYAAEIGPGQKASLYFNFERRGSGRCRLRLGNATTTVMVVKPVRLANGYILHRALFGGSGQVTFKNPYGSRWDGIALMVRSNAPRKPVIAVYVRAGGSCTVTGIPDGVYGVYFCLGRDWNTYTRDFLTTLERARYRAPFAFSTSSWTTSWTEYQVGWWDVWAITHYQRHTQTSNWTIYLNPIHQGRWMTAYVPSRRFPPVP